MSIINELSELVKAGVISAETADGIRGYYQSKKSRSANRLFIAFGILGAILVGLGIILIIAHNWDELSRVSKTFFAFLPLVIGQLFCGFTLLKKQDSTAWREGSATFLFFSVGAGISLISQIYHIPGDIGTFLLTWMLLVFPLIYLLKSSATSILYLIGITAYAVETGYGSLGTSYYYWLLLLVVLLHYYRLYTKNPGSNFMFFHNWLIPGSVVITLGTVAAQTGSLMFIAYFSLFGFLYLVGNLDFFKQQSLLKSGYTVIGSLGTLILLLILSFDWFWKELRKEDLALNEVVVAPEFFAALALSLLAGSLLYLQYRKQPVRDIELTAITFVLFILIFMMGLFTPLSVVLVNFLVFLTGLLVIRRGAKRDQLGVLNYGLLIITVLITCRFFDTDLSFIVRGILFVLIGIGFFTANYQMLKRRKN